MLGLADPVDVGVVFDGGVVCVDEDDFVPCVGAVFGCGVGVEDFAVGVFVVGSAFGDVLVVEVDDAVSSHFFGFSACFEFGSHASAAGYAGSDEEVALFSFVADGACAVEPGGVFDSGDCGFFAPVGESLFEEVVAVGFPGFSEVFVECHGLPLVFFPGSVFFFCVSSGEPLPTLKREGEGVVCSFIKVCFSGALVVNWEGLRVVYGEEVRLL